MITSAVAHGGWFHILGNMIFYLAFAPALELLIGSRLHYIWIMMVISFVVGICTSIAVLMGAMESLPSLGFSGVVTGMIGLSAYLMPQARIRVFWWYVFGGSVLHVPAWILAVFFIGMDTWTMLTASDYGYVNVVAHVGGGFAGYLYGYIWLKERREETREELSHEVKAMSVRRKYGKTREDAFRHSKKAQQVASAKQAQKDDDRFMGRLYQMVKTHRDGEAVLAFHDRYGDNTPTHELEKLCEHIEEWGPSRFLLCLYRLIMFRLDKEKRHGKAILYMEKCQRINPEALIHDLSKIMFYAKMAMETHKTGVAKNLLSNSQKRYGDLVNHDECHHLLQKL